MWYNVWLQHLVFPRCRERHQVGMTNRWRLPDSLYSDLLGNSQALKAVDMPYNSTLVSIITGTDSPQKPPESEQQSQSVNHESLPQIVPGPLTSGYANSVSFAARQYNSGGRGKDLRMKKKRQTLD